MTTIHEIQAAVCRRYGVGLADLLSDRREQVYVRPRHAAMWLCRRLTRKSYAVIGRAFDRDHSSVQQAVRWFEAAGNAAQLWELLAELQKPHVTVWPHIALAHGWVTTTMTGRVAA